MRARGVLLMGWVHRRRDLGGVIFIHMRDREGVTQVVFHEDLDSTVHGKAECLRSEYVVAIEGQVELRSADTINATIPTGEVEVVAEKLWILNESLTPPFPMEDTVDVSEDMRLKHRYVDLRRPPHAAQYHAARARGLLRPRIPELARLPGNRNPVHDAFDARRRPATI